MIMPQKKQADQCKTFLAEHIVYILHVVCIDLYLETQLVTFKESRNLATYFIEQGIGWKIEAGKINARSPEALEHIIGFAMQSLQDLEA